MCDRPLLVYSLFACCAPSRDLGEPGGKDGYFSGEQISVFQETANGGKMNESQSKGLGVFSVFFVWVLKHTMITRRSRGQVAKT